MFGETKTSIHKYTANRLHLNILNAWISSIRANFPIHIQRRFIKDNLKDSGQYVVYDF